MFKAAREGKAFMQPSKGLKTNVYAYAKKDLSPGDVLDGLGGFAVYGPIEMVADDVAHPGIPICLAEDAVVTSPIRKDQKVSLADLNNDLQRSDLALYRCALSA